MNLEKNYKDLNLADLDAQEKFLLALDLELEERRRKRINLLSPNFRGNCAEIQSIRK